MSASSSAELTRRAHALKAAGRLNEAIGVYAQVVKASPTSGAAEHNLAASLGDAGRWAEAEAHLREAFSKGVDAPETWLVSARCLLALGRHDESERAFREAIRRRGNLYEAHRELAQLRWMRSADAHEALVDLDAAIRAAPEDARLAVVKAQALEYAGRMEESYALLKGLAGARPGEAFFQTMAAQAATTLGKPAEALALAEGGAKLAPGELVPTMTLTEACLASGDAQRASDLAAELRTKHPNNQHAIALQATAWRILGDARYRDLYDYGAFVSRSQLDTPPGWSDLPAYLSDLAAALTAAHRWRTHPFNQSLRHGSQSNDLLAHSHPAIRALQKALDGPIKRRIQELGAGDDPVRKRNTGKYAFRGMWSVRLNPGGFHIDHVHPQGWLSSACYIETVEKRGKEGWLRFGQPGVKTTPPLEAEHFVEPQPGLLALFPSYMWHGTMPFSGDQTRLTVAFDLVPG